MFHKCLGKIVKKDVLQKCYANILWWSEFLVFSGIMVSIFINIKIHKFVTGMMNL